MRAKLLSVYGIAILLGVVTGVVGACFQIAIAGTDHFLSALYRSPALVGISPVLCSGLVSMVMVLLAWWLVQRFSPESAGSGVQEIEGRLLHERPLRWARILPVKFVGGVLAIGARLVLGREGPTIQMGGALGGMAGDLWKMSPSRRDGFIAAGAAAGLATAFNAPLAGILFVIEEMRNQFDYSFTHFKMVAISCVFATLTNNLILGSGPAITMPVFAQNDYPSLVVFFFFGIIMGFAALYFNRVLTGSLRLADRFGKHGKVLFVASVGFIAGGLSVLAPNAVGGGYPLIEESLGMGFPFITVVGLILVRFGMSAASYSTGVPGGVFAPMLALGTLIGVGFSQVFGMLFPTLHMHPAVFAVAGMAALFSASVRAPVTGIVLVVEMTWNYELIFPLLMACLTSTTVMQLVKNPPLYTQLLRRTLSLQPQNDDLRKDTP